MMERFAFITSIHVGILEDRIAGRFFKSGAPMLGCWIEAKGELQSPAELVVNSDMGWKFLPEFLKV